jgi:hypothetical protein
MTESPTPSKFAKWKRPLIGGTLSTLIAWIFLTTELGSDFGFFIFYALPFFILELLISMDREYETQIILISLLFWFPVGFLTALFIKDNRKAIFGWSLLCIIFGLFGFFALMMLGG